MATYLVAHAAKKCLAPDDPRESCAENSCRRRRKIEELAEAVRNICTGECTVGSSAPLRDVPRWVTLRVVQGGFTSGIAALLGFDEPSNDSAIHMAYEMLESGKFSVEDAENAALLVMAWLYKVGMQKAALDLRVQLAPMWSRIRFYPQAAAQPVEPKLIFCLTSVGTLCDNVRAAVDAMDNTTLPKSKLYQKLLLAPRVYDLRDRILAAFIRTLPSCKHRPVFDAATNKIKPHPWCQNESCMWPLQHSTDAIRSQMRGLLMEVDELEKALTNEIRRREMKWNVHSRACTYRASLPIARWDRHTLSRALAKLLDVHVCVNNTNAHPRPDTDVSFFVYLGTGRSLPQTFDALETVLTLVYEEEKPSPYAIFETSPASIGRGSNIAVLFASVRATCDDTMAPRMVGMLRRAMGGCISKRGNPTDRNAMALARSQLPKPSTYVSSRTRLLDALKTHAHDAGLPSTEVDHLSEQFPALKNDIAASLEAPLEELCSRAVVTSAESLGKAATNLASMLASSTYGADIEIARVVFAMRVAHSRRRSLLVTDNTGQFRFDQYPWIQAVPRTLSTAAEALVALKSLATCNLKYFPVTLVPNPLIDVYAEIGKMAGCPLVFTKEIAADIFTHSFTGGFVMAADQARKELSNTLYSVYFNLDAKFESLGDSPTPASLYKACTTAPAQMHLSVLENMRIIEWQQLICGAHNMLNILSLVPTSLHGEILEKAASDLDGLAADIDQYALFPRTVGLAWRHFVFLVSQCENGHEFAQTVLFNSSALARHIEMLRVVLASVRCNRHTGRRLDSAPLLVFNQ